MTPGPGRRPTKADLEAVRGRTIPDLLPDPLRLLFVGINPSLWSAATGAHYARPGNRFYPALHAAGVISHVFDAAAGYAPEDLAELEALGIGTTNVVPRATARADELTDDELRAGRERLEALAEQHRPRVIAVNGVGAYRTCFGDKHARVGIQERAIAGAQVHVLPNPSGLNARATVPVLAEAYREAARAAGIPLRSRPRGD